MSKVAIIDYGAGNTKSIEFALNRLGVSALLSSNPGEIRQADKVIFPGVGQAAAAMKKLEETGLNTMIPQLKQPVLGICLGMQLLCNFSEEGSTYGFGVFDTEVKRFPDGIKVPQIGWNTIFELRGPLFKGIPEHEYMYSVHSYYAAPCKETAAMGRYELNYAAALQKNNYFGVQFHPEKSGKTGARILSNFLEII